MIGGVTVVPVILSSLQEQKGIIILDVLEMINNRDLLCVQPGVLVRRTRVLTLTILGLVMIVSIIVSLGRAARYLRDDRNKNFPQLVEDKSELIEDISSFCLSKILKLALALVWIDYFFFYAWGE